MVACILLWLLALASAICLFSRMARAPSTSIRRIHRLPTVAAHANLGKRVTRPLPQDHLSVKNGTQSPTPGIAEDVHRPSMPGAWLHERRKQNMFDTHPEPVSGMAPWTLICVCAWARFLGTAWTFAASDPLDCNSNDVVAVRTLVNEASPVCQGPGSNKVNRVAGITTPAVLDGAIVNCLPSQYVLSTRSRRGSDMASCDPSSTGNPVIKDHGQTTILDAVRQEKIGLPLSLVASTHADRVLCQEVLSQASDCDESSRGGRTEVTEDEDLFGISTQCPGTLPLERKDEYRALGRRQDGALTGTGCPLSLRRAHSTGYLWRKRDIFDDGDDVASDDSYWSEQVNARLSGVQPHRYNSSDVSLWPQEGREDETDNWRIRDLHVTRSTAPEEETDVQQNSGSSKLCPRSSPPLSANVSLSGRAGRCVYSAGPISFKDTDVV